VARLIFAVALLLSAELTSAQTPDDAPSMMGTCNCVCKQGTSRCMPSFSDMCNVNLCGQTTCGGADQVDAIRTGFSMRPCPVTIAPGTYDTLVAHVHSAIGHQGARLWTGPENNSLLTGETLRLSLLGAASNSDSLDQNVVQAVHELQSAKVDDLERATKDAIAKCLGAFPMDLAFQNFQWVADHEGKIWALDAAHKAKNYDEMRSIFSLAEHDHDEFRNNLYCYSGAQVDELMTRLGAVPPFPQPKAANKTNITGAHAGPHPD
jgi:hypothetical protein